MRPPPLLLAFMAVVALQAGTAKPGLTYLYTYNDRNGNIIINNMPPSYVQGQGLTLRHVGVGHVRLAMSRSEMAKVLRSPELLEMVDSISVAEGVDPHPGPGGDPGRERLLRQGALAGPGRWA